MSTSTPSKNFFESFIDKLTPNKSTTTTTSTITTTNITSQTNNTPNNNNTNKRATFNGSSTPSGVKTPTKQGGNGNGGMTTSSSTNLLGQFQVTIEPNNINKQSDYSTNFMDFSSTAGEDEDPSEKYLTYKDSTVVVNKEKVEDHYLTSIEPQLSVLNKPVKKEKPKPLVKQQSFHKGNIYIDPSTPIGPPSTSSTSTTTATTTTTITTSNIVQPILPPMQQTPQQPQQEQTTTVNNKQKQQPQQQPQPIIQESQLPISGGNSNIIDSETFSFANMDIPMACRLFLDHLKSENGELKRQLNIVLNDNAEQWEQTIDLQSNIKELEDYNQQLDNWSDLLRGQLMNSAELLVNHHKKIDNLYELLGGIGEQKDSFQTLYSQSQDQLSNLEEDNLKLKFELKDYKALTQDLDLHIKDLNKEILRNKDFSIETIVWRIKNNIEPSGIERKKSIQEKVQLLEESVRIHQLDYNDHVLLKVITFLKNTLDWKVFITMLKNNYDSLDYYIKYCKQTKKIQELKQIYRETHNHLEEFLLMLKQALDEKDTNLQLYSLYSCVSFLEPYDHLYFYKSIVLKHIDSIKTGINLNLENLDFKSYT